jgi:hypothetical protein
LNPSLIFVGNTREKWNEAPEGVPSSKSAKNVRDCCKCVQLSNTIDYFSEDEISEVKDLKWSTK